MMGNFDEGGVSHARMNKNKKYYENHLRAMQAQKEEEEEGEKEYK